MNSERWTRFIGQLAFCHRKLRRQLASIAALEGLNDTEFLLLSGCQFASTASRSQQEIAASIGLSPSQASGVFERLRIRGLIEGTPARDRRRQAWSITAAGRTCVSAILRRLEPLIEEWEGGLSESDQLTVLRALSSWSRIDVCNSSDAGRKTNSLGQQTKEAA